MLERVRGTTEVDAEFEDIVDAVNLSKSVAKSKWSLLYKRRYRGVAVRVLYLHIGFSLLS